MHEELYRQMRDLEDRHWWFLGRRRIVRRVIERLGLKQGISILDAGCGTGGNLSMLAGFGDVVGMEYDVHAAEIAGERGAASVVRGKLPGGMPFDREQFELVTLIDVLEHIDDDQGSLRALKDLLQPGGHLVLTVPAFAFLWGAHDVEHHHHRRYLARQLRECLENCGLQVQWVSYYNSLLFPLVAAIRLFRKLLPERKNGRSAVGSDLTLPPKPVNKLLERMFASERFWLGRLYIPFGVSLIAVARKP